VTGSVARVPVSFGREDTPFLPAEGDREGSAFGRDVSTAPCRLSTVAIFRSPSILRNLIYLLATRRQRGPP
jgi:hypothetical protein